MREMDHKRLHCPPFILHHPQRVLLLYLKRVNNDLHIVGGFHWDQLKHILPVQVMLSIELQIPVVNNNHDNCPTTDVQYLQEQAVVFLRQLSEDESTTTTDGDDLLVFSNLDWSKFLENCPPRALLSVTPVKDSKFYN